MHVSLCVYVCACHYAYAEVRGQLASVGFFLLLCKIQVELRLLGLLQHLPLASQDGHFMVIKWAFYHHQGIIIIMDSTSKYI